MAGTDNDGRWPNTQRCSLHADASVARDESLLGEVKDEARSSGLRVTRARSAANRYLAGQANPVSCGFREVVAESLPAWRGRGGGRPFARRGGRTARGNTELRR